MTEQADEEDVADLRRCIGLGGMVGVGRGRRAMEVLWEIVTIEGGGSLETQHARSDDCG